METVFLSLHLKDLRQLSSQIFRGKHSRRGNSKCGGRGVCGILKEQGGQCGRGVTGASNRRWRGNRERADGGGHGRHFREFGIYPE